MEHRLDAEVLLGSQTAAIEVVRRSKTPQRKPAICSELTRIYDGIWYFCPKALEAPLRQSFGQLGAAARRKFSLVLVPR